MVKSNFCISIDTDIASKLNKEANKSSLIQSLLNKHYQERATPDDMDKIIGEAERKKQELIREQEEETRKQEEMGLQTALEREERAKRIILRQWKIDTNKEMSEELYKEWLEFHDNGGGWKDFRRIWDI